MGVCRQVNTHCQVGALLLEAILPGFQAILLSCSDVCTMTSSFCIFVPLTSPGLATLVDYKQLQDDVVTTTASTSKSYTKPIDPNNSEAATYTENLNHRRNCCKFNQICRDIEKNPGAIPLLTSVKLFTHLMVKVMLTYLVKMQDSNVQL